MGQMTTEEMAEVAEWFTQAVDYPAPERAMPAAPAAVGRFLPTADALTAQRDRVVYCGLFDIGNPEPPVPLLESHYHRDPTARLRRVVNFYRAYGVVQDPHHAPDHLCVELAYLAYLARVAALYPLRDDLVDAVRGFARAHPASFVGKCARQLRRHDQTGVYASLFEGLAGFLAAVGGETAIAVADDDEHACGCGGASGSCAGDAGNDDSTQHQNLH